MFNLVCVMLIIMGLVSFIMSFKHLLNMLISLEFMVLTTYLVMFSSLWFGMMYISMLFLIFSVCEGILGLTILVGMSRAFGGDYFNTFSMMG